jgi:tRNA(Ile)-lysidine synthase
VKRNEFNALPPAFRRRLLKKIVDLAGGNPSMLSRDRIDSALSFMATARTGRTMNLYPGLAIGREYDRFVINAKETAEGFTHTLAIPGITAIPELGMEIDIGPSGGRSSAAGDKNYRWQAVFDYDKIKTHLTLRSRRPGDWFCPSGMGGKRKKLQDYFVDEKIPRRLRSRVPLLCAGDDILWVMGLRTDGRFLPAPETKNVLGVTVRGEGTNPCLLTPHES